MDKLLNHLCKMLNQKHR